MNWSYPLAVLVFLAPVADAATLTVTRFDDPAPNGCLANDCSLREAVVAANATTAADIVVLSAGTYSLTRTCSVDSASCQDLDVTRPLTIVGAGPETTTIANAIPHFPLLPADRAHTRVLEANATQLTLQGLGLRSGYLAVASSGSRTGGCLLARTSTLTMTDVRVEECTTYVPGTTETGDGGGIALVDTTALMTRVFVTLNDALNGGGMHVRNGSVRGTAVQIRSNAAAFTGGGIMLIDAPLTLGGKSRISTNGALRGGGMSIGGNLGAVVGGAGAALDERLWVIDNGAYSIAGGVLLSHVNAYGSIGAYTLRNLRVVGNMAVEHGAGMVIALVAAVPVAPLLLTDSEIAENDTNGDGGGLYFQVLSAGPDSVLQRLSFWKNSAAGRGGAMRIEGAPTIRHVSTYYNQGIGGGSSMHVPGSVAPTVSFYSALEHLVTAIATDTAISFQASVITGECTGPWIDLGNNFRLDSAVGCPGTSANAAQLSIAYGEYGSHPAVGITSPTSILRDQALNFPGTRDVRGYLRQGLADVGAFEYDGVP